MPPPELLILEPRAPHWAALLPEIEARAICCATAVDAAPLHARHVLARPDLAAAWLRRGGRCDWLQSTWAGVEPLAEVLAEAPPISRPTGVFGPLMAEYVLGLILQDARGFARYERQQTLGRWQPRDDAPLVGRTLTIAGAGDIGRVVAARARAFGLRVLGLSRSGRALPDFDAVVRIAEADTALAETDYLLNTLPHTPATRGLFDRRRLALLPRRALFINVGRASAVDHGALIALLRAGALRGAVLDVLSQEPLPPESPLWRTPALRITPHVSAPSRMEAIVACFRSNRNRVLAGKSPEGLVHPDRGY